MAEALSRRKQELRAKLEAKHWSEAEIEDALKALDEEQKAAPYRHAAFNKLVYFLALFLSMVGNFAVSVMLIPFIVLAEGLFLYPGLFIISLSFGALFDLIVYDIEKVADAPRFKQGLFLFAVSLINIWLITQLSAYFGDLIGIERATSAYAITAGVYVVGFMIPHLYTRRTHILEAVS